MIDGPRAVPVAGWAHDKVVVIADMGIIVLAKLFGFQNAT